LTRQTTDGPAGRKLAECFLSSVPAAPPFALVIDVMYNGEQQLLHNAAAAATAAAHKHSIPPSLWPSLTVLNDAIIIRCVPNVLHAVRHEE
jgi:hypothetical protein